MEVLLFWLYVFGGLGTYGIIRALWRIRKDQFDYDI